MPNDPRIAGGLPSQTIAGYTGMMLAVQGNVRVAAGALRSFKEALEEGLVPEGESLVYPVQQGIPILLIQEGIQL